MLLLIGRLTRYVTFDTAAFSSDALNIPMMLERFRPIHRYLRILLFQILT